MTRRVPLWSVLLVGCAAQYGAMSSPALERWRPEFLLIILTNVAMRSTRRRGALLGLIVGWLLVIGMPGHSSVLLVFCVLIGYGLGWLRTQWDTERFMLSLVLSWAVVLAWHSLSWLIKWSGEGAPRPWSLSFVVAQTSITVACAAAWWRYALRWIAIGASQVRSHES